MHDAPDLHPLTAPTLSNRPLYQSWGAEPRKKPLLSTKTRVVFHAFRGIIAPNIGKNRPNRGWNGHRSRTSPCFWLFGGEMSVLLFALLYRAKRLEKQPPRRDLNTENNRDLAERRQQNHVNRWDLCNNLCCQDLLSTVSIGTVMKIARSLNK